LQDTDEKLHKYYDLAMQRVWLKNNVKMREGRAGCSLHTKNVLTESYRLLRVNKAKQLAYVRA